MNFVTYSAGRDYFLKHCNFLQYYDEWAYDYTHNDIVPYWDKNNYWDEFPIKLGFEVGNIISLPGKNIVGGIAYTFENHDLHIKRLFTCKRYRRKGVAKQLLEEAWKAGYKNNCRHIRMWCDKGALPFYNSLGYNYLGTNCKGYGYVYTPMLAESMHDSLNTTKGKNAWRVLIERSIKIPDEAKEFSLVHV